MPSITDDIAKANKSFQAEWKSAQANIDLLKKNYVMAVNHGKKISDDLRDAGMALAARRKALEEVIDRCEEYLKSAKACGNDYDMLARKAADAEKYLEQMRKDEKANAQRFKAAATDKKIKLEAEAFAKALDKAERDHDLLSLTLKSLNDTASTPQKYFEAFEKARWTEMLAEYVEEQRKFSQSLRFFNDWNKF
jgi:ribosomal protein L25 (general stress protein Ctc)